MRKITKKLLSLLLAVAPLSATAQFEVVRGLCTPDLDGSTSAAAQVRGIDRHKVPAINTNWDPTKTYRQLVVLVEFADFDFNLEKLLQNIKISFVFTYRVAERFAKSGI